MNRTSVDWWSWRSHATVDEHAAALGVAFGRPVELRPRRAGYLGYECSAEVMAGDVCAGMVAYGGTHQRGWTYTSVTGQGCSWVEDWDRAQDAADQCRGYEPKRVDIALDVFDGSSGFDATLQAYRSGGFTGTGRPPRCEPMKPERPEDSAIIRIGTRSGNKYLRGYEKGRQVLGSNAVAELLADPSIAPPAELQMTRAELLAWWRLELETKAQDAPLPEDIIDRRDQYFAGSYPYLSRVLRDVDAEPLVIRRAKQPVVDLALALQACRAQYGNTLFTALTVYGGDVFAVWDRIIGRKHCQRLVDAGVLMVDHDA